MTSLTRGDHLPTVTDVSAAITAGGRSTRFGSDKALFVWQGRTLLEHVALSLHPFSPKVLVAPEGRYDLPGWSVRPDIRPGAGPLAGLEVALAHGREWVAFAGVDLPFLTTDFWWQLCAHRTDAQVQVVCPVDANGRAQPLAALYHTSLLPLVSSQLNADERRMGALLSETRTRFVPWAELQQFGQKLLHNANTPDELE